MDAESNSTPVMSLLSQLLATTLAVFACGWFLRDLALIVWPQTTCPRLRFKDCSLTRFVLQRVTRLTKPYHPPLWARSSHVQTLTWYLHSGTEMSTTRELLQMKDKGLVALDWTKDAHHLPPDRPILLLIPALHQNASHMATIALEGVSKGLRPVVFQRRGHGDLPLTTPRLQAVGEPSDLHNAVRFIRARWPVAKVVSVGESSGASLLLSFLGDYGSSAHVSASVVISPWWNMQQAFEGCETTPITRLLQWCQVRALRNLVTSHANVLESHINMNSVLTCSDLAGLELGVFAKLNGFSDLDSYWERNSPTRDVDDIAAPVLAINAADDPVFPSTAVPYDLTSVCPNFIIATTEAGGHGAFLEENESESSFSSWASKVALEYVTAVLEFEAKTESVK